MQWCGHHRISYFETSAKDNTNITHAFNVIARYALKQLKANAARLYAFNLFFVLLLFIYLQKTWLHHLHKKKMGCNRYIPRKTISLKEEPKPNTDSCCS